LLSFEQIYKIDTMVLTAELSLYPLIAEYEESIISFIKVLKAQEQVEVFTHSMSTFIKGPSHAVFLAINKAVDKTLNDSQTASLVIKVINRDLPVEKGFLEF